MYLHVGVQVPASCWITSDSYLVAIDVLWGQEKISLIKCHENGID